LSSNLESVRDAARSGLGITVAFSYKVAKAIKSGELIPVLQDFPPPQPISFVYHQIVSCPPNCVHSLILC
jgi:DNA-binding transcriptional LysR family regulator